MKAILKTLGICCILFAVFSCEGEIDPVKEFTNGEEIRYPGKPLDMEYFAGRERLEIRFKLSPDPNIEKAIVYWDMKTKSVEIAIDRSQLVDNVVTKIIDNLPENIYSFETRTVDKFGNYSIPENLIAKTYGKRYESFLSSRQVTGSEYVNFDGGIRVIWGDSILSSRGVELSYTTLENKTVNVFVENKEDKTTLSDVDKTKPLKFRTVFYPEENAIDAFYTSYDEYTLNPAGLELPKPYASYFVEGFDTNNKDFSALWDNKWGRTYSDDDGGSPWGGEAGWKAVDVPLGSWITIDLKAKYKATRYRTNFYWPYKKSCVKTTQVWAYTGEGEPTGAEGWDNWVKIGEIDNSTFVITRDDKVREYPLGDNIHFAEDDLKAQYYRVLFVDNWTGEGNANFAEMTFWVYPN